MTTDDKKAEGVFVFSNPGLHNVVIADEDGHIVARVANICNNDSLPEVLFDRRDTLYILSEKALPPANTPLTWDHLRQWYCARLFIYSYPPIGVVTLHRDFWPRYEGPR